MSTVVAAPLPAEGRAVAAATSGAAVAGRWALFPRFVLRRAGFAFDRLGGLALGDSAPALEAAVQAALGVQGAIDEWNRVRFPEALAAWRRGRDAAAKGALERVARAVRRGQSPQACDAAGAAPLLPGLAGWMAAYGEGVQRLQAARRQYREAYAQDFQRCRSALGALGDCEDFREALLLLAGTAPANAPAATAPRNSGMRQREQLLFKYAQRLCAKNETNSFFGPVHYGDVAAAAPSLALPADWDARPVQRQAFFSHWAIDEMAAAMVADPRLQPLIARSGGADCLRVAPEQVHALQALQAQLSSLRPEGGDEALACEQWLAALARLQEEARRYACAPSWHRKAVLGAVLEEQFRAMGGGAVRRNAGRMFRTRGLVYEDGWVDAPVAMPAAAADTMRDALAPVLDIALLYTRLCRAHLVAQCRAVAQAWFGSAACVPYDRFIVAWHEQQRRPRPLAPALAARIDDLQQRIQAFDRLWTSTLDQAPEGQVEAWPLAAFAAWCAGLPAEHWAVVSPDLLPLREPGGGVRWVLGEIHHGVTMDGWMLSFAPDAQACKAAIDRLVAQGVVDAGGGRHYLPANLVMQRRMKTAPQLYPGLAVALSARAAPRPAIAAGLPQRDCSVRELQVQLDGEHGLGLVQAGSDLPVRFYPPAFGFDAAGYAPFEACSLPLLRLPRRVGEGPAPRCSTGGLVIARAEWRLSADELPPLPSALDDAVLELNRWRSAQGMPRHVFLKSSDEPKPLYIDWLAPHAVECVLHLRRRGGRWVISEMLPGPGELWLGGAGGSYTSECRFLMTMGTR